MILNKDFQSKFTELIACKNRYFFRCSINYFKEDRREILLLNKRE